jgi:exopolyphosphatase/guanosine-5'-triphosphate,3'-diphosphate pyrophosphatase
MKLAAIDIGTNSIHTIIADVASNGSLEVVDRFKEMVRLGEGQTDKFGLSSRAITDGLAALSNAKSLCDSRGVEQICAVATSAVRESPNGAEFLSLVRQETGIRVKAITGQEESRLIYQAVRESISLNGQRALIVDIGGGSVEFIVGTQRHLYFADSVKCGVLRLRDRFPLSEPTTTKELNAVRDFIERNIKRVVAQVRDAGFDVVVGTSGTILALLHLARGDKALSRLHNVKASQQRIRSVVKQLSSMRLEERKNLNGIAPGRADTILPGAVLLETIMRSLDASKIIACEWALREGVLLDYLHKHQPELRALARHPDPRRRSVFALAQRCNWAETHSQQVASLALMMFDQLKPLHGLDAAERELLEYGALLHDIGYHISAKAHHKHGHYLVMNGGLLGFTPEEIQMIAAIVRYHRRRAPQKGDIELDRLSGRARRAIEILAGILRIADGLDRTHFSLVQRVETQVSDAFIDIIATPHGDAELEMWYARRKSDLLATALGREIRLHHGINDQFTMTNAQ